MINWYFRLIVVCVDFYYFKIVDNGDNICCFFNLESGVIFWMCEFFRVKLEVDCICKVCEDKCIYCCFLFIIWVKEYFELGKCYYYICLLFNKDVYYYFGDYD